VSLSCVSGVYVTFIVYAVCLLEVCFEPKFKDAATQWEDLTKTDHSYAAKLDHMNKSTQALGQTVADMLLDDDASRLYTGLRL